MAGHAGQTYRPLPELNLQRVFSHCSGHLHKLRDIADELHFWFRAVPVISGPCWPSRAPNVPPLILISPRPRRRS